MSSKIVGILGSLIVVLAIAVVLNSRQDSTDDESIGQLLLPELDSHLNGLTAVEISKGDDKVTLRNKGDSWVVDEKSGYQADFSKLLDMTGSLSKAKIVERKTSREENLGHLGLSGDEAVSVNITSESGAFKVLLGNEPASIKGRYARYPDENQAWLVDRQIVVKTLPSEWLDPIIINIDSEQISRVKVESPGGERLEVERVPNEDNMKLVGIKTDQKLKYPSVTNELSQALVNVRLEDVVTGTDIDWSDAWKTEFQLLDLSRINITTLKRDEQHLMRVELSLPESAAKSTDADTDAEAQKAVETTEKDPKPDMAKYQHLHNHVFEISSYVYDEFAKTSKDLIEE